MQKLVVGRGCNLNYAKRYSPALQPPKSTPRHKHLMPLTAVKHMASPTAAKASVSLRERDQIGPSL